MRVFIKGDELEVSIQDWSEEFLFAVGGFDFIFVKLDVEQNGVDLWWSLLFFDPSRL